MVEAKSKVDMPTNLDSDSETEEEPPGLMAHDEMTDDSDDEDFAPNCVNGSDDEDEIPGEHSKAAPARTSGKRSGSHLDTTRKVVKRRKNQRNTSHASKLECLDVQEIKHCLETKGCSCGEDCLKKLRNHGARAVRAIEKLRLQRFQGKDRATCKTLTTTFPTPRGEDNS